MNEESVINVKNIVSKFTKIKVEDINNVTPIDKTILPGSIIIHRMYSHLKSEGFPVENYSDIRTFGSLMDRLSAGGEFLLSGRSSQMTIDNEPAPNSTGVGIDIEFITELPDVKDYWESEFYADVFSKTEIAHCLASVNPKESFLGKFAAKEAIIKADNYYATVKLNTIEILNSSDGKPSFGDINISISHSNGCAVAVALILEEKDSAVPHISVPDEAGEGVKLQNIVSQNSRKVNILMGITALIVIFIVLEKLIF